MEIKGKIVEVFPLRSGQSSRGDWQSQDYLLETHETYPKKMLFSVGAEERIKRFNIQKGQYVSVFFDVDAHEYNGKWFNSIRAWDVKRLDGQTPSTQNQPSAEEPTGDLPF